MPQVTPETAPIEFAKRGDIRFAYRHFGLLGDTPLAAAELLCGEFDSWDPKVTNGLAPDRDSRCVLKGGTPFHPVC